MMPKGLEKFSCPKWQDIYKAHSVTAILDFMSGGKLNHGHSSALEGFMQQLQAGTLVSSSRMSTSETVYVCRPHSTAAILDCVCVGGTQLSTMAKVCGDQLWAAERVVSTTFYRPIVFK